MANVRPAPHRRKHGFVPAILVLLVTAVAAFAFLSVPAFAKNTYVITDGSRSFTYSTYATDPGRVLDEAGLELEEGDTYTTLVHNGTASITVNRSQRVTIIQYGRSTTVSAFGETVSQLLARLNIVLEEGDVLSASADSDTYNGMILRIDHVVESEQTYTSAIPFETTYCYDSSLPDGDTQVLTAGIDGEMLCSTLVTYVNGEETERAVLSESIAVAPVTEIVAIGTGKTIAVDPDARPVISDGYIYLPTGEILAYTQALQMRATAYTHTDPGCDMITSTGTTVHIGTVAVDPRYIPYGTRMFIVANDGSYVYGISTAEDCGGAIKGDRIDLYFPTYDECIQFGCRNCTVYILGTES